MCDSDSIKYFCCLGESMYRRNSLLNLGPKRAESYRSITVLLWRHSAQLWTQKALLCQILCFFFWASEKSRSYIPVTTSERLSLGCPNSSFFPTLPQGCWGAASPGFTDHVGWATEPGCKQHGSGSHFWDRSKEWAEVHFLHFFASIKAHGSSVVTSRTFWPW